MILTPRLAAAAALHDRAGAAGGAEPVAADLPDRDHRVCGHLVDGGAELHPVSTATTVRTGDGGRGLGDGDRRPAEGRPGRGEPLKSNSSAGAWLNWSVCIEWMMQRSSACFASCGKTSEIISPLFPLGLNLKTEPRSLCGPPGSFASSGFQSNVSR